MEGIGRSAQRTGSVTDLKNNEANLLSPADSFSPFLYQNELFREPVRAVEDERSESSSEAIWEKFLADTDFKDLILCCKTTID